ncbi:Quinone oxidoreductase 1 [Symmachiella dynata]|uniref:NADPH:quinone oxidoreductase family protein n=1 Tax=Symmachiella dynata TaxID=2527995 RepID=UPI00118A5628|nr:NADPH:quinone oxidoreductase family protein [Symmachiella dynata]QDT46004.1 Quinone oxidoreductase 1 [Symmachiella dynata]
MKAVLCKSYGPPENLTLEEIPDPQPAAGQVLIDIHAAGLNFPDTLQIAGKYQFQPPFPFIPGAEVAGTIAQVGEGVTEFQAGDRVMALPGIGGMAQRVVADATAVDPIPDAMDFETAAGFGLIYHTSYHALKQRADLQPGETLLVLGASGGVGLAAVEIGKAFGARVIAAASTDEKLAIAQQHGADELINYGDGALKDKVKNLTGGKGADVIYDPVGGDLFDQATRCVNWKGRILVVGFTSGTIPKYPTNLALLKGCQLVGVFWGDFRRREPELCRKNCAELFDLYEQGRLKPLISQVFPLEQYVEALNVFINRQAVGKIVLGIER